MANYATLKAAIAAVIKQNGNNEITGNLLQQSLMSMIDSLTVGYQFVGFCSQNTDPGTPDQKVFYLARSKGIYNNFGGVTIEKNGIYMFRWTTEWTFTVLAQFDNAVNTNSDWLTLASACATAILASKADLYSKGVESLPEFNGWMSSAGAYQASNAQYLLVPISPGEKIRFVNVNANATIYCFLKGYDKLSASGELFDICNGKSRVTLASNEDSGELTAPDDVFCVLVGRRYDGNRRLPNIFINGMNVNDVVSASKTIVTDDVEITAEYGATSGGGQILANFTGGYLTTPNYIRCNATINGGLSVNCPDYEFNIFAFDTDKNIISNTGWNVSNTYVSIPDGTKYIKINFRNQQLAQLPMEKEITIVGLSRISGEQIEEYNDNKPNAGEVAINAPVGLQISNPLANEGTAQTLQDDDNTIYINHGVLRLPTNYKETGAPTKLIVFCHGWSEHYNASSYQIATTSSANIAYLLKEGFAVFDMDGNVKSTSIGHGCSDMAVECYMAGLKWVFRRFNLDRRIYLAGHSQ